MLHKFVLLFLRHMVAAHLRCAAMDNLNSNGVHQFILTFCQHAQRTSLPSLRKIWVRKKAHISASHRSQWTHVGKIWVRNNTITSCLNWPGLHISNHVFVVEYSQPNSSTFNDYSLTIEVVWHRLGPSHQLLIAPRFSCCPQFVLVLLYSTWVVFLNRICFALLLYFTLTQAHTIPSWLFRKAPETTDPCEYTIHCYHLSSSAISPTRFLCLLCFSIWNTILVPGSLFPELTLCILLWLKCQGFFLPSLSSAARPLLPVSAR